MEKVDLLKREDLVTVKIFGPDNVCLYQSTGSGYHNILSAIDKAIEEAKLNINPEDCVFEISNQNTDVTHKYRLNAHSNLKLIV